MRKIKYTTRFKRDYKREKRGRHKAELDTKLLVVVRLLTEDVKLPESMRDHSLSGEWSDCKDCHISPDLVLIYRKPDISTLELVRLGSHSELGF